MKYKVTMIVFLIFFSLTSQATTCSTQFCQCDRLLGTEQSHGDCSTSKGSMNCGQYCTSLIVHAKEKVNSAAEKVESITE